MIVAKGVDRADLQALADGCLRWLSGNIGCLVEGKDPAPQVRLFGTSAYKIVGEVGLLLMVYGHNGAQVDKQDYWRLLEGFCAAVAHFPVPLDDAPSSLRYLLNVTGALEANGLASDKFRDMIRRLLRHRLLLVRDETPWGVLGFTYFLDLCAIPHDLPSPEALYELSILQSRPPLPSLTLHDKYAVTHLLFFLADFGARRDFFTHRTDHAALCAFLDEVTASCLIDEDWDLIGECLIGYDCLAYSSPVQVYAWSEYLTRQHPDGCIEAPRRVTKSLKDPVSNPTDLFHLHYHQTLVGMIAALPGLAR